MPYKLNTPVYWIDDPHMYPYKVLKCTEDYIEVEFEKEEYGYTDYKPFIKPYTKLTKLFYKGIGEK